MTLSAKNISISIGNAKLLDSVSLELKQGEILAVVGPNGAGKSTLLKVLSGEMKPNSGQVTVAGQALSNWRKQDLAKVRAVLPQSSTLSFGFTVQEVVMMGRTPHIRGQETHDDYQIITDAMQLTRISHLADRTYTTLSGGERQRVQLARVLAQIWSGDEPRYLLLDEPTNNLDLSHQHSILKIARQFANQGVAVLTILHDLNLAAQFADRVLILKHGRTFAEGTPQQVFTAQTVLDTFDLPVMIQPHPCYDCPLIIPIPQIEPQTEQIQPQKETIT